MTFVGMGVWGGTLSCLRVCVCVCLDAFSCRQ
jgi:hypothetical protein